MEKEGEKMNAEIFWLSDFLKEEKDLRDWFKEKWVDKIIERQKRYYDENPL